MFSNNILILGSKPSSPLPDIQVDEIFTANGAAERGRIYREKYKNTKLNFVEIAPGPINTVMRKNKKENKKNILQADDVSKICLTLSEINLNVSFDTIKIFPKKWNYHFN